MAERDPITGRFKSSIPQASIGDVISSLGAELRTISRVIWAGTTLDRLHKQWTKGSVSSPMLPFTGPRVPSPTRFTGAGAKVLASPGASTLKETVYERQSLGRDWDANVTARNLSQLGLMPSATEAGGLGYLAEIEEEQKKAEQERHAKWAKRATDAQRLIMDIRDPEGAHRRALEDRFGLVNAAEILRAEEVARAKEVGRGLFERLPGLASERRRSAVSSKFEAIKKGRAIESEAQEAERLFRFDQMDEEGQERERLRDRYKGAIDVDYKVEQQMDKKQREKYLSALPKMLKESKLANKLSTKQLGSLSHGMQNLAKVPGVGAIGKMGPVGGAVAGFSAVMALLASLYNRELGADKKIVELRKAQKTYGSLREGGGPSGQMSGLGILGLAAGLDETAATKSLGRVNQLTGGNALAVMSIFKQEADELARKGLQHQIPNLIAAFSDFGFDENVADVARNLGTKFKDLSPERQKLVAAEMSQREFDELTSSSASLWQQASSLAADYTGTRRFFTSAKQDEIAKYSATTSAAVSAETYQKNHALTDGGGSTTTYGATTITIGTMKVEGGSAKDMVGDVMERANVGDGQREGILRNFDEGQ